MSSSVANTTVSGITEATGRTSTGRGGRTGRGRGRNAGRGHARPSNRTSGTGFKGDTELMNGNVFECFEEQRDRRQFVKTKDALEAYLTKITKHPEDFASLFDDDMAEPELIMPVELGDDASTIERAIWDQELKEFVKRRSVFKGCLAAIQAVILGQCSENMKDRLKALPEFKSKIKSFQVCWLLAQIQAIMLKFDARKNAFVSLMNAQRAFLTCTQLPGQSVTSYLEELRGWAITITQQGANIAGNLKLIPESDSNGKARTTEERQKLAYEKTLAIALVTGADPARFGPLIVEKSNRYASGYDEYPEDVTTAFNLLVTYCKPNDQRQRPAHTNTSSNASTSATTTTTAPTASSAITFTQSGAVTGSDGITHGDIECFRCHSYGHYASTCPSFPTPSGTTLTHFGFMMAQAKQHHIDPTWILLDSQSTISVFNNPTMLSNIRPSQQTLRAITNGGHQDSNMIGDFRNLGVVWYNPSSIANILSLSEVRKICRVTLDTSVENSMCVHRLDGSIMKFLEHVSGLYVYATAAPTPGYTLLETVVAHKKLFTNRQIANADLARELYRKLGRPSEADFQTILTNNLIRNCPVTSDDARRALHIYGPDVATLKGKMTRSAAAPHTPTFEAITIPSPLLQHHGNVTLCIDFFFVQGIGFLHTISRNIGFRTVSPIADRSRDTILREVSAAIKLYTSRGFIVRDIHTDQEFGCIREDLRPIVMNLASADSHVGEVERSIRTIKERLRSYVHGLPFRRLPRLLITHMVIESVRTLNQFPRPNGVSSSLSPASIITGSATPDYAAMRIEFGAYAQVFDDKDPTNTPRSRSLGAIALTPTGNVQGDYHFLSLASGARISRHAWTEVPLPDTAIARVEALALHEGRPLVQDRGFVVEWRPDHPIDNTIYDLDYDPPAPAPDDDFAPADYDPVDHDELHDLAAPFHVPDPDQGALMGDNDIEPEPQNQINIDLNNFEPEPEPNEPFDIQPNDLDVIEPDEHMAYDIDDHAPDIGAMQPDEGAPVDELLAHDDDIEEDEGAPTDDHDDDDPPDDHPPAYNLRPRTTGTTSFRSAIDQPHSNKSYFPPTGLAQLGMDNNGKTTLAHLQHYAFNFVLTQLATTFTQMSERAGLRKHGKVAEAALMAEFAQLENMNTYESLDPNSLTNEQKRAALRAINLFKEKRNGIVKGRTCADGRSQRNLYDKSQTASPTVSTDALMLSIIVEAYERRDIGTADVVGAYLRAFMDDYVIMKFVGASVKLLCQINPKYQKHVVKENGVDVLYVRLIKALYGCVKSALLWYELFSGSLKEMGFVLNPYDPCVANCTIEGTQCTIVWYVDDAKVSHVNPSVVSDIISRLEGKFGKMTVTRGRDHVFLGMDISYNDRGTATITMKNYLKEAIQESGLNISKAVATPANRELFEVDEAAPRLPNTESEAFHRVTAKLLYVALRARPDLLLAIAFLSTRVSKSTTQDQAKLQRVLEYIYGSMDLDYIIGADDIGRLRTWVDASYAVHPDMRSHTGGAISFGRGAILCKSVKQKLNTKSPTEAEFVGASDYLPNPIWVKNFLEAQGYNIQESILEQDNESAIKLEKNGRMSAGPKSRHIAIRYFWMKDRIISEHINVRHCPTLQMVADFFTKPLQGTLFKTFRSAIMGHVRMDTLDASTAALSEERVGKPVQPPTTVLDDSSNDSDSTDTSETWADIARKPPGQVTHVLKQENQTAWILVGNKSNARNKHTRATRATALVNNVKSFERSFSRNNPSE